MGTHQPARYDDVAAEVQRVQYLQLRHDQIYHPDIFQLPPIDKLTHLVLHINKYIPHLLREWEQMELGNWLYRERFIEKLVDLGIIVVSMANVFQLRLGHFTAERLSSNFTDILPADITYGMYYCRYGGMDDIKHGIRGGLFDLLAFGGEAAGLIIEHQELSGNLRVKMTSVINSLWMYFHVTLHAAAPKDSISYAARFTKRLEFIESRNQHYDNLPKYKDDFKPLA